MRGTLATPAVTYATCLVSVCCFLLSSYSFPFFLHPPLSDAIPTNDAGDAQCKRNLAESSVLHAYAGWSSPNILVAKRPTLKHQPAVFLTITQLRA